MIVINVVTSLIKVARFSKFDKMRLKFSSTLQQRLRSSPILVINMFGNQSPKFLGRPYGTSCIKFLKEFYTSLYATSYSTSSLVNDIIIILCNSEGIGTISYDCKNCKYFQTHKQAIAQVPIKKIMVHL